MQKECNDDYWSFLLQKQPIKSNLVRYFINTRQLCRFRHGGGWRPLGLLVSRQSNDWLCWVETALFEPFVLICLCARARTRGSAPAPPWPAALPHPLQGAPAPPFPPPCLARLATRTAPTVLSPVPPRPWRAETAGSSVRHFTQADPIPRWFLSFKKWSAAVIWSI